MKMFLGTMTLISLLIFPAFAQHEESQSYDENEDSTYLPNLQEEHTDMPILEYGTDFDVEDELVPEQDIQWIEGDKTEDIGPGPLRKKIPMD